MKAVVTVIGKDKVGIIAGVSSILAGIDVNILDISQTIMQEYFTMIMLVDTSCSSISFEEIKAKLNEEGKKLEVSMKIQNEGIFNSMNRV